MSDTIYTVIKGDTATKITKKFNISLGVFKKLNPTIKNINKLSIGQKVKVGEEVVEEVEVFNEEFVEEVEVGEEQYLIFIEEESGEVMSNIQYSFKKIDGTLINGISDSFGKTNILLSEINSGGEWIECFKINPSITKKFDGEIVL